MMQTRTNYWRIPIAKNGNKLPVVIVTLTDVKDAEKVMELSWIFENQKLFIARVNERICYKCSLSDHEMKCCPIYMSKRTIANMEKCKIMPKQTKIIPTIDAWKEESQKLIQEKANTMDKEIEELRKIFKETNANLENLEKKSKTKTPLSKKKQRSLLPTL